MQTLTQAERLAQLEIKVELMDANVKSMDAKLDNLLALRNKGAGAFWLSSILFGTSIVGVLGWFFDVFKGG